MVNQINNPTLENAVGGNGASSAAAAKDDDDMSVDIEIGTVDDADEYTIDQSHADGGGGDDLQKTTIGAPIPIRTTSGSSSGQLRSRTQPISCIRKSRR